MAALKLQFSLPGVIFIDGETALTEIPQAGQFIASQENWLALAAVQRFLEPESPGTLAIFGPPGVGKSHLLTILEEQFRQRYPEALILRKNAADFGQLVAEALASRRHGALRRKWQQADLVILDDLQFLVEYPAGQAECVAMLESAERGRPLVAVASRVRPWHIPGLAERIGQILEGGLTAPVSPPSVEVRKHLLQRAFHEQGLPLTQAAAKLLAEELAFSARQIFGLAKEAAHSVGPQEVDYAVAQSLLRKQKRTAAVSIEQIARATGRYFGIPVKRLRGPGRERAEVLARDVAMYLSQRLAKKTLAEIGRYFGGRDHTTVGHGCRKIEVLVKEDFAIQEAILVISEMLGVG